MTILSRLVYRTRQFKLAFLGPWHPIPDAALTPHLAPALLTLYRRMHPSEQAHSFAVLQRLQAAGQTDPDLLTASLLHDVGKIRSPLSIFDRILVVLARRFLPRRASRWGQVPLASLQGQAEPVGFRRPFVTAACHPAWGADLASEAGASPRTCDLIRRHQDADPSGDPLLLALHSADDFE